MLTDSFVSFSGSVFRFGIDHWEVTQMSILLFYLLNQVGQVAQSV